MSLVGYRCGSFKPGERVNGDMLHEMAASLDGEVDSPEKEGDKEGNRGGGSALDAAPDLARGTVRVEASDKKVVLASGSERPHWVHVLATALLRLIEHVVLLAVIAGAWVTVHQKGEQQVVAVLARDFPGLARGMHCLGLNTPKEASTLLQYLLALALILGLFCAAVSFFFGIKPLVKAIWLQILLYVVVTLSILYFGLLVMLFVVAFAG